MTRIIDVSVALRDDMVVYPNNPRFRLRASSRIADGGRSNVSEVSMGTHTGTHVDAPKHFVEGGTAVDDLPLDVLLGPCWVLDLTEVTDEIRAADLAARWPQGGCDRLLLKTTNSGRWAHATSFPTDYIALATDAAELVVERKVKLVGIDWLSVERFGSGTFPVHHTLLEAQLVILEGLDLASVEAGAYELACLPLKLAGGDGAPARAVLIER